MTSPDISGVMCGNPPALRVTVLIKLLRVFDWTMLPMPKEASTVRPAKMRPRVLRPSWCSSTYMGPPTVCPSGVVTRYLTESSASAYLVAMPNTPVSHIHRTAPGPPT